MRVCCTATADYRSNAVGELELECTAEGLRIVLHGVSSYREGYAPGPPVHESAVCVPWPAVYATRLGERQLQLSVDARNLPLNRFLLSEFVERLPNADPLASQRRRPYVVAGVGIVALGAGLSLTRALPHARTFGTVAWALLVVAVALGLIGWRARGAPRAPAHVVLDELCHDLARYVPHHISVAAPTPAPRSFEPVAFGALLPRSAIAIAITLAAATLAALVGSSAARPRAASSAAAVPGAAPSSAILAQTPFASALPAAESMPASDPTGSVDEPPTASVSPSAAVPGGASPAGAGAAGSECACVRQASLLWQAPLPRVTPLIVSERTRLHDAHEHTELELALVNDGARELHRLEVSVVFFERRDGDRAGQWQTGERPLYFEGPLAPGESIRWHVEGRGASFDVIAPDRGSLAPDGSDAAPAEAFVRLASSDARALRLHGVTLLAFLNDARAESAGGALRPSASPAESDYLDRLREPPRELSVCDLHVSRESSAWRIDACAFNRSDQPTTTLEVRLLAFDAPIDRQRPGMKAPALLAEHRSRLEAPLPARGGRRFELSAPLSVPMGSTARAFETHIDRVEAAP